MRQQFKDKGGYQKVHVRRIEATAHKFQGARGNGKGKRILGILKRTYARDLGDRTRRTGHLIVGGGAKGSLQQLGLRHDVE